MLSEQETIQGIPLTWLEGVEAINMIRKGQVKRLAGSDTQGQAKFVLRLFQIAAERKVIDDLSPFKIIFATQPSRLQGLVLRRVQIHYST